MPKPTKTIRQQIESQLRNGKTPQEVIASGFSKSYVYSVKHKLDSDPEQDKKLLDQLLEAAIIAAEERQIICIYYNREQRECGYLAAPITRFNCLFCNSYAIDQESMQPQGQL